MAREQALDPQNQTLSGFRSLGAFFKRNLTPKLGAAVALWRLEVWMATPLALVFIATLGRWEGALAQGTVMAAYSAAFLFLLDGERFMDEMRDWARRRKWVDRSLSIAERTDRAGRVQKAVAVPGTIMFMGPFWRAITYNLARVPRLPAYVFSVGGSFPHSLFWTGLVLGGLYEIALRPALEWVASVILDPVVQAVAQLFT
jgi:hypothetical protein